MAADNRGLEFVWNCGCVVLTENLDDIPSTFFLLPFGRLFNRSCSATSLSESLDEYSEAEYSSVTLDTDDFRVLRDEALLFFVDGFEKEALDL